MRNTARFLDEKLKDMLLWNYTLMKRCWKESDIQLPCLNNEKKQIQLTFYYFAINEMMYGIYLITFLSVITIFIK